MIVKGEARTANFIKRSKASILSTFRNFFPLIISPIGLIHGVTKNKDTWIKAVQFLGGISGEKILLSIGNFIIQKHLFLPDNNNHVLMKMF